MLCHFERNVKLIEASRDRWHKHVNKICLCGNENEILSRIVSLWFGLSQKVNNNALEDKALCPKLTFWERRVCWYDQALVRYCLHSSAHAWLIDAI